MTESGLGIQIYRSVLHRPYASMNWIRFNGSLRAIAESQPLAGTPLVNAMRLWQAAWPVKWVMQAPREAEW